MSNTNAPIRFPKVKSPFERHENEQGEYVVFDSVNSLHEWVFETDENNTMKSRAVEKLHGTNTAVRMGIDEIDNSLRPKKAFTRHGNEDMQYAKPLGNNYHHRRIVRAVQNSFRRGYLDDLEEGVHYGETVGPDFHNNMYELDENLFIPFSWLYDKCSYNSWGEYGTDFTSIREWFEDALFSLFYSRMHGCDLETSSVSNNTFCEGIIFVRKNKSTYTESKMSTRDEHVSSGIYRKVHPDIAKLRRDMFAGSSEWDGPIVSH